MTDPRATDGVASSGAVSFAGGPAALPDAGCPIVVERLAVRRGSVEAILHVSPGHRRTSTVSGFADALLGAMPELSHHICLAAEGVTLDIRTELAETETAHAVEHVALELLRSSAVVGDGREIPGHTAWGRSEFGEDRFRVRLGVAHDVAGASVLVLAVRVVNAALAGGDLSAAVAEAHAAMASLSA